MLEAITLLKEDDEIKGIPTWYKLLDCTLALGFYILMGYIYISIIIWLKTGR